MVEPSIITALGRYTRELEARKVPVEFTILFGSQVNGAAHSESDIDLVVVSKKFDGAYAASLWETLWTTVIHTDNRIEPIPCGLEEWKSRRASSIVEIARREGIIVYPDGRIAKPDA